LQEGKQPGETSGLSQFMAKFRKLKVIICCYSKCDPCSRFRLLYVCFKIITTGKTFLIIIFDQIRLKVDIIEEIYETPRVFLNIILKQQRVGKVRKLIIFSNGLLSAIGGGGNLEIPQLV
jgi:hypothetical protein